jgi:hypothetical protein
VRYYCELHFDPLKRAVGDNQSLVPLGQVRRGPD